MSMSDSKVVLTSNLETNSSLQQLSTTSLTDRWRKYSVKKNKGFLAQPINKVGFKMAAINKMLPQPEELPEVIKSMFPRSVVYEIAYKKKQNAIKIEEALRKEREALAEKVKMKMTGEKTKSIKDSNDEEYEKMRKTKEPFWYNDGQKASIPPQNLSDYDVDKGMPIERPDQVDVMEKMGISQAENYIPGQISGKKVQENQMHDKKTAGSQDKVVLSSTKDQIEHSLKKIEEKPQDLLTETEINLKKMESECHPKDKFVQDGLIKMYPNDYMGMSGRRKKLRPLISDDYVYGKTDFKGKPFKNFPENKARLTTSWDDLRSSEFMKVGKPFKTAAVRWSECRLPAFHPEEETKAIQERLANRQKPPKIKLSICEKAKLGVK